MNDLTLYLEQRRIGRQMAFDRCYRQLKFGIKTVDDLRREIERGELPPIIGYEAGVEDAISVFMLGEIEVDDEQE